MRGFLWGVKGVAYVCGVSHADGIYGSFTLVEVADRQGLEKWLEGKPREVPIMISARVASRVFPHAINGELETNSRKYESTIIIARALLVSSVAAYAGTEETKQAATTAATAFDANTAYVSTDAAAYSVSVTATVFAAVTTAGTTAAFAAAAAATTATTAAFISDAAWMEISKELTAFDEGLEIEEVLGLPLWAGENPLAELWQEMRAYLNGEPVNWSFWIDWYQRILDGSPQNWEMLEEIALIDPEDWDKGAEHVNGMIAGIQARYAVKETVEAAQKVLTEYPVAAAQMGHNNPPEDIEDDLFTDEDAVFVQKMLDDIGEESESIEPDVSRLRTAADGLGAVIRKISVWLAKVSGTAFFGTLATSAVMKVDDPLFAYLKKLSEALQPVIEAIGKWLPFIGG